MKKLNLLIICLLAAFLIAPAFANSTWQEVTRYSGAGTQDTAYFTCNHAEWRLNWSYTPTPGSEQYVLFAVAVKSNESELVSTIYESGNATTEGASYIHGERGTFYLAISAANLLGYTIIIQQDADSIPEIQGPIAIVAISCAMAAAILTKKRGVKK